MVLFALREVALLPLWKQSIFGTFLSSLYTRHCESIVENIFRYVAANCRKIASRVTRYTRVLSKQVFLNLAQRGIIQLNFPVDYRLLMVQVAYVTFPRTLNGLLSSPFYSCLVIGIIISSRVHRAALLQHVVNCATQLTQCGLFSRQQERKQRGKRRSLGRIDPDSGNEFR